ncbi:hypothetical protein BD310DRAFT_565254 [Dichomitus squalens]|uniref:Uncharacterized protein n=1 Tax=Dichomitus squalens TaxID=114155 RepID=A0A4Q9PS30_9APHY|nr:hypothetical protein BD310DRAFT_565254 [Dichomitus squalens]
MGALKLSMLSLTGVPSRGCAEPRTYRRSDMGTRSGEKAHLSLYSPAFPMPWRARTREFVYATISEVGTGRPERPQNAVPRKPMLYRGQQKQRRTKRLARYFSRIHSCLTTTEYP